MISFMVSPAASHDSAALGAANIILAVLYVLAAVTRLAHFNRLRHDEGSGSYFNGLVRGPQRSLFPLTHSPVNGCLASFLGCGLSFADLVYNCRIPKNLISWPILTDLATKFDWSGGSPCNG